MRKASAYLDKSLVWLKGEVKSPPLCLRYMSERLVIRLVLLAVFGLTWVSGVFAQAPVPSATIPKPNEADLYSESVPYEPRDPVGKRSIKSKPKKTVSREDGKSIPAPLTSEFITFRLSVYTQRGEMLRDLKASEVHVLVGDIEQPLESIEIGKPLDVVIVMDLSPSTKTLLNEIRATAAEIISRLEPDDRVMIVGFAGRMKILTEFTTDRKSITNALKIADKIADSSNGTSLYDTIADLFSNHLNSAGNPPAVILFTDAIDKISSRYDFLTSLQKAEAGNASVFPIFFDTVSIQAKFARDIAQATTDVFVQTLIMEKDREKGIKYLNELISLSGGRGIPYIPQSMNRLAIATRLITWLRGAYAITIKRPEMLPSGLRKPIRVRIDRPKMLVLAKGSYLF